MNGTHQGGIGHLQSKYGKGVTVEVVESTGPKFAHWQIVEAVIQKFKLTDIDVQSKFGMSLEKLLETVAQIGFIPPSIRPAFTKIMPSDAFKMEIISMIRKEGPFYMKPERWKKLFPDHDGIPRGGNGQAAEELGNDLRPNQQFMPKQVEALDEPVNAQADPMPPAPEPARDESGQILEAKEAGETMEQTVGASAAEKVEEAGEERTSIPEKELERIFEIELPFNKLVNLLCLAADISLRELAKRVSEITGEEVKPEYFSLFIASGLYSLEEKVMEAVATVLGLQDVWADLLQDSWQNYKPANRRDGGAPNPVEIPTDKQAEIFADQTLSSRRQLLSALIKAGHTTSKALAEAAGFNSSYFSTLLGKPNYYFESEKIEAIAGQLGLSGEKKEKLMSRFGYSQVAFPPDKQDEIFADQTLSSRRQLLAALIKAGHTTSKALAEAAGFNSSYFSTLLGKPDYQFSLDKVEAMADHLGLSEEHKEKLMERFGCSKVVFPPAAPPPAKENERAGEKVEPAVKKGLEEEEELEGGPEGNLGDADLPLEDFFPVHEEPPDISQSYLTSAERQQQHYLKAGTFLYQAFERLCEKHGKNLEELVGTFTHYNLEWAIKTAVKLANLLELSDQEVSFLGTSLGFAFPERFTVALAGPGPKLISLLISALAKEGGVKIVVTI